jgi:diguanylate cyclase (GGDEF)-like protein
MARNRRRRRRESWKRPPFWIAGILVALLLFTLIDLREKADADFSLFYIAAVAAAGWFLGRRHGVIAAILAAAAWTFADASRRPPDEVRFAYWNGFTRLMIFLFAALAMARIRADERRLSRSRRVLEEENLRARTDLTMELLNARGFLEHLDRELIDPRHRGHSFSLACIDIEGLERFGDGHESEAVDALLRNIAGILRRAIRASDLPARLDREELAVGFWDVERDVAEKTLRRIVSGIAALGEADAPLSARVGLVRFVDPPDDPRECLRHAEKVLHEAHATQQTLLVRDEDPDQETPAAGSA